MKDYKVWFTFEFCSISVMVLSASTDEKTIIAVAEEIVANDFGIHHWSVSEWAADTTVELMGEWKNG